jgi:MoaA/NifB/PqqE/SkfB family radical SAM enzyme
MGKRFIILFIILNYLMQSSGLSYLGPEVFPFDNRPTKGYALRPVATKNKELIQKVKFPKVADWLITNECNMQCAICWGLQHSDHTSLSTLPMSVEEQKSVIERLKSYGITTLTFTGGEPLLLPNIIELVKFAKSLQLKIIFFTNTLLLAENIEIIDYIDSLVVPIDSADEYLNSRLRGPGQLQKCIESIRLARIRRPDLQIQVGTVVNKLNKERLEEIGSLLKDIDIDRWKLNIYRPIGRTVILGNSKQFEITQEDFRKAVASARRLFPQLNIIDSPIVLYDYSYLFVTLGGELLTSAKGQYISLGNIKSDDSSSLELDLLGIIADNMQKKMTAIKRWKGRSNDVKNRHSLEIQIGSFA